MGRERKVSGIYGLPLQDSVNKQEPKSEAVDDVDMNDAQDASSSGVDISSYVGRETGE